ncbi:OmpA family protein [Flagellimonas onchidii]|uniref:OmpA family protein n=1 Tax=Flagellimonas onchidii TaxID=2562684 RepID=UPI0010A5C352|nr:OmpA family protein [Allomuricauda onchidii]
MKKVIPFIIFYLSLQPLYTQKELQLRAKTYFERAFYSDAIPLYEQLLKTDKSQSVLKNLADSYYNTYNLHSAARWYKVLISKYGHTVDSSYYFKLSQTLKAIGKYDEAYERLENYHKHRNDTVALGKLRQELLYIENISAIGNRFSIKNLPLNSSTSEFGAARVDSTLVYSAARKKNTSTKKLYRWNNQNYLDIYTHPIDKISHGDSLSKSISSQINTKMHEGTFAITKDRKTIYFTRNSFINGKKRTDAEKITNLKIYKAVWLDKGWGNITELPFNSTEFSIEHPALNKDETKLYFASDRPGGHGSFDLYSVDILSNGRYGNPINLGNTINTSRKEQFPYLDSEDNLYFASNGHPGFGLLDIFFSKFDTGVYKKPDNLGLPLNSGYDDFSISFYSSKKGFFSSNRPNGKGSDDIYSFIETKPLVIEDCQQFIVGFLTDQITNQPIPNGTIKLLDYQGKTITELLTDNNAQFSFAIECSSSYTIFANKEGYQDNYRNVASTKVRKKALDGSLQLLPLKEVKKQQLIQAQKNKEAKIKDAIEREDALVKEKNRTIIKTQEIHFDYSLWYLRRESRERLQVVVQVMTDNPNIIIEIGTHTDIRGNEKYNRNLSQKRADVVKEFLISKGITPNRIIAKGYGESQPIVKCKTENDCSEEDHEWNRRCEFVIKRWD